MRKLSVSKGRAWSALGLGPLWLVNGPNHAESQVVSLQKQPSGAMPVQERVAAPAKCDQSELSRSVMRTETDIAQMDWQQLQSEVADCHRCRLCETRRNTVFGVGDTSPRWLVIGEAPGANEDAQGQPFVGEAGRLLDAMLSSVGASRDSGVFILNVLKCRPPGNRDPAPAEVASCSAFLQRQVALLKPDLIFSMGRFAAQALLQTDQGIGALRQRVHEVAIGSLNVPLVVGYHPAYLLRRPEEKARAWQDICLARSVCDPAEITAS